MHLVMYSIDNLDFTPIICMKIMISFELMQYIIKPAFTIQVCITTYVKQLK